MPTEALNAAAAKICSIASDYRADDGTYAPDVDRVFAWLEQFDQSPTRKLAFLTAYQGVLDKTYISKKAVRNFIERLVHNPKLVGSDPVSFWEGANLLEIQQGGNSQNDMNAEFGKALKKSLGLDLAKCGSSTGPFVYLDDVIFSGNRVVNDIRSWIEQAPKKADLIIITAAIHTAGWFNVNETIKKISRETDKSIKASFWRIIEFKNMSNEGPESDVLRLTACPDDERTRAYVKQFFPDGNPALMRSSTAPNASKYFPDETTRRLLEGEFWQTGLAVREACPNFRNTHRPLGYTSTNSKNKLGFGSMIVSYRNCPNNAPLSLWAGDPWIPLFPRKNN